MEHIFSFFNRRKVQAIKIWHDIIGSLWFRPGTWMIFSIILATALVALDGGYFRGDEVWDWAPWFLRGDASGARAMLGSISSATLTVASLAFSLMMVTVVQTANAYSPRIISQFLSDKHNQNVLGILLGTFLYSLLVLRAVTDTFVPLLAVNVAIPLAVFATVALVSFISHVAQSLKVSHIAELILAQTESVINDRFPSQAGQAWSLSTFPTQSVPGGLIYAQQSGYIQLMDATEQLTIAKEANVTIQLLYGIGDHILEDAPIAEVWPVAALDEALADKLRATIAIGWERTDTQDVSFGIRQLVDIALRALSPGVNDPTTATDMMQALKQVLAAKLRAGHVSYLRADESDRLRLILPLQTLEMLVNEAFLEILHYGAEDFMVDRQLLLIIKQLRFIAKEPADQEVLWQLLTRIVPIMSQRIESEVELGLLNEVLQQTTAVFERDLDENVGF